MAKQQERTRPGGSHRHSVLEGREYISGVPGRKNEASRPASKPAEDCDSVLGGPECIQGVETPKRKSGK